MNIYKQALEKWGVESQLRKIQEEAMELALSVNNIFCETKDYEKEYQNFITEVADVAIMLKQAELIIGKERLDLEICHKLEKLQKYLDKN